MYIVNQLLQKIFIIISITKLLLNNIYIPFLNCVYYKLKLY